MEWVAVSRGLLVGGGWVSDNLDALRCAMLVRCGESRAFGRCMTSELERWPKRQGVPFGVLDVRG